MAQRPRRRPVRPPAAAGRRPVKKKPAEGSTSSTPTDSMPSEPKVSAAPPVEAPTKEPVAAAAASTANVDNNPKAEKKEPAKKKPEPKKKAPAKSSGGGGNGGVIILAITNVLAIAAAIYFYLQLDKLNVTIVELRTEVKEIENEKKDALSAKEQQLLEMKEEFERIKDERDKLGLKNEDLNNQMARLENQLVKLRAAKSSGNANTIKSVNKDLEKELAEIKLQLIAKDEEVTRLKRINNKLADHVDKLITKQGKMVGELTDLEDKINVASILHLEKSEVGIINTKSKYVTDEFNEFKKAKINKIRINFNVADNKVAEFGYKTFHLKLIDPEGKVLFDLGKGGGSFTMADGKTDFFTTEKNINFDNTPTTEYFEYVQPRDYASGVYQYEIYADGHKVASENFTLQ